MSEDSITATETPQWPVEKEGSLYDSAGEAFNPDLHESSKGSPRMTKGGKFHRKRSVKKSDESVIQTGDLSAKEIMYRTTAQTAAGLFVTSGLVLFGDEWQPKRVQINEQGDIFDEMANLNNALYEYIKTTNQNELDPRLMLMVALGGYALPRFTQPKTKGRLQMFFGGVWRYTKGLFSKVKNMTKKGDENADSA